MRSISLIAFLLVVTSIFMYSQNTPKTVSMSSADNNATAFGTEGTLGTDVTIFYTHWDATYLYLGWSGGNTLYSSDMYFVAIDVIDNAGSNGSVSNVAFSNASSDFYVVYENNDGHYGNPNVSNGNLFYLFQDNGSNGWNQLNATNGDDGISSQIVFSDPGEVRLRIAWSDLGFTPGTGNPFALTFWTNNETNNFVWSSFPSNNPINSNSGETTTLTHKLFFPDSGSGVNPSTASTVALLSTALPVELKLFTATPKNRQTALQFTTASELNNDYFEIQRAADSRNWEKIGRVDGAGTTQQQQDYHFVDERPLPGINYYRLKQVDYDGQYEYSEVLSVQLEDLGEPIEVYPNPAQEFIRFTLPVGAHTISLLDVTGQLVQRLVPGSEQIVVEMDIQDLLPATYYLMIYNSANELISSEKVIKL
jgi:hypothetical protein